MTAPSLPASLAPWAEALGALDVELAVALGPMVRGLDAVFVGRADAAATHGERDGWDGLSRRGEVDRLLVSEWLLADELPDEFLRRAVSSELLYLDPGYRDDVVEGRVVCLVDVGPDQLGAGRLVQLAALVVLQRRAAARNTTLRIGLLSGATIVWLEEGFADAARQWLRGRSFDPPDPDVVTAELGSDDPDRRADEVWVLCGPALAAHLTGRPRTVTSTPGEWDDDGVRTVRVRVDHRTLELVLPPAPVAVTALRGGGFAGGRAPAVTSSDDPRPALRWPVFPAAGRRVVARGPDATRLAVFVVDPANQPRVRIRRYPGPVVAATVLGARTIALVVLGDDLVVRVVGRPLYGLDDLVVPGAAGLAGTDFDGPVDRLVLDGDTLLWRHGGAWFRLTDRGAYPEPVEAVGWSADGSTPRVVRLDAWPASVPTIAQQAQEKLVGVGTTSAWTADGRTWSLHPGGGAVDLEAGERPLGLTTLDGRSTLVTRSASGLTLRCHDAGGTRTLTRLSGAGYDAHRDVHPTRPWLVTRRGDRVEVVDLTTEQVVVRVTAEV